MNKNHKIGGGLAELPDDGRDFSHEAVFGSIRAQDLPTADFMVSPPLVIKDQKDSDLCTAFATTAASEDQEGVILDPSFTFFATKVLVQKDPDSWGADLRSACQSHVDHGALESEFAPFPPSVPRSMILDEKVWTEDHKADAYEHRKISYFKVDGPHDLFDNIRMRLWMGRFKMQSVITGAGWRPSWTDAPGGMIPLDGEGIPTPHAFIIKGQRRFPGESEPRLIAQLSNGDEIGDKGIFYFPREVVNKEFRFGAFMFEDLPKEKVKTHLYYGTKETDSLLSKFFKIAWKILLDLFK